MPAIEPTVEIKERIRAELSLPPFAAMISLQHASVSPSSLHCHISKEQHRVAPLFVEGDPYHIHLPALGQQARLRLPATLTSRIDEGQGGWQLRFAFTSDVAQEISPLLAGWQREQTGMQ